MANCAHHRQSLPHSSRLLQLGLLDDPLSAVNVHLGMSIIETRLFSFPPVDRARGLVTHALHVLDTADYIYVKENGIIFEQGSICFKCPVHLAKPTVLSVEW